MAQRSTWKKRLSLIATIIGFLGLVTFAEFIIEESFQTVMFGTWAAQDAEDWVTVKAGIDLMIGIERLQRWTNYIIGWIQPLAFLSYRSYASSERYYIRALRSKCFAHAPHLFDGEMISFQLTGFAIRQINGKTVLERAPIRAVVARTPQRRTASVEGIVIVDGSWVWIR